eukprot:gb/GFBE01028675.1/.p1 GENE.gb/GFBE01028675.1/~~gb/GFBE01028675.1/.p1  ORF type:complete len:400 (+),score=69.21 gb/GFBE01028675.1/:1-1200(+)
MAALAAAGLQLPSLGLVLYDGGRVSEACAVQSASPAATGGSLAGSMSMSGRGISSPPPSPSRRSPGRKPTSRDRRDKEVKGRKSKRPGGLHVQQTLGIPHSARLHSVEEDGDPFSVTSAFSQSQRHRASLGDEDPGELKVRMAAEEDSQKLQAAFDRMVPFLATLKPGSLALEVGSRSGDVSLKVASRFPELYVQPTEGTGETSPAVFLLLQERLSALRRAPEELGKALPKTRQSAEVCFAPSRLLQPRYLDGGCANSWKQRLATQSINCIFVVNVLHYLSPRRLEVFLQGCRDNLAPGGMLLICGPFINGGEAGDDLIVFHGVLKDFSNDPERSSSGREMRWGVHDTNLLRSIGDKVGLELLEQQEVPGTGGSGWLLLVMHRPMKGFPVGRRRTSVIG